MYVKEWRVGLGKTHPPGRYLLLVTRPSVRRMCWVAARTSSHAPRCWARFTVVRWVWILRPIGRLIWSRILSRFHDAVLSVPVVHESWSVAGIDHHVTHARHLH